MSSARHDPAPEDERGRLHDVVHLIQAALPDSDLSARRRLEIGRDLAFLAHESRRTLFRPEVAAALCAAVLAEVSHDDPRLTRRALRVLGVR